MLDIRRLRYFKVIAECGSMAAASRQLNVAQPSLSSHIAQLEERYGLQLFHRHARGVVLTPAGEALLHHADHILDALAKADADLRHMARDVRKKATVRLGLLPSWGSSLAPAIIAATAEALPDVSLRIIEMRHDDALEALKQRSLDLAVTLADAAVEHKRLLGTESLLYVSKEPAGHRLSFREIVSRPLILPSTANRLRKQLDDVAKSVGLTLSPIMEIDGQDTIKSAVKAGVGGSIMTWNSIRNECRDHILSACAIEDPEINRGVYLSQAESVSDEVAQAFFTVLQRVAYQSGFQGRDVEI